MGRLEVGGFSLRRPMGLEEGRPGEAVPASISFIGTPHLFHLPVRFPTLRSLKTLHQLSTLSPFQSLLSPRQPGCYSGQPPDCSGRGYQDHLLLAQPWKHPHVVPPTSLKCFLFVAPATAYLRDCSCWDPSVAPAPPPPCGQVSGLHSSLSDPGVGGPFTAPCC